MRTFVINFLQDFVASTHSSFLLGQTDRGLTHWPDHLGETWLFKQGEGWHRIFYLSWDTFWGQGKPTALLSANVNGLSAFRPLSTPPRLLVTR
jgi:hypothetical protein